VEESPVDRELVTSVASKIEYTALLQACQQLAPHCDDMPDLPSVLPEEQLDDGLVAALHKVLFDIHVTKGFLVCPDTGRRFPINDGIPNMILHEDEV
jgi:multifunctional methyltransferase subunit TRM112